MSVEAAVQKGELRQTKAVQFEDLAQQNESYVVGMWSFLVTEIMFFGALFLAYVLYRWTYSDVFAEASHHLQWGWGATNTVILLTSSLFMALAVHAAQTGKRKPLIGWLTLVILCAFGFLGIKYIEYSQKIEHHLFPGPTFRYYKPGTDPVHHPEQALPAAAVTAAAHAGAADSFGRDVRDKAQMFFSIYFAMTGLHGIHVLIGIVVMGTILILLLIRHPSVNDYMVTEMAGLYWHFVDIVWIFLFPLFYLIPS